MWEINGISEQDALSKFSVGICIRGMSFITTKFQEILLSGFRGVVLTRRTGLADWLTDWAKTLYPPQLVVLTFPDSKSWIWYIIIGNKDNTDHTYAGFCDRYRRVAFSLSSARIPKKLDTSLSDLFDDEQSWNCHWCVFSRWFLKWLSII